MSTRYEGENGEPDLEVIDYFPADKYTKDPVHAKLSTLLAWHKEDPVDAFEQNRNEVVYSYQQNRNPYIDHPEFADRIWGPDSSEVPTNHPQLNFSGKTENPLQVFPNPFTYSTRLSFPNPDKEPYQLTIFDSEGRIVRRFNNICEDNLELSRDGLRTGLYIIELRGTGSYRKMILIE